MTSDKILILDFGSQYTQLITRRIRELKIYSEIHPFNYPLKKIKDFNPKGIILSGGPSSVYEKGAPKVGKEIFELGIPVLGICYGMQIMTRALGGKVLNAKCHEYGNANVKIKSFGGLFKGLKKSAIQVWASHADRVTKMPTGFKQAPIVNFPQPKALSKNYLAFSFIRKLPIPNTEQKY